MTRALTWALLSALVLFAFAPRAEAQPGGGRGSDFWEGVRDPARRRARTLLRHGLQRLSDAEDTYGMHRRAAMIEGGLTRLRLASTSAPDDPAILLALGLALARNDEQLRDGTRRPRTEEALRVFTDLRALDPRFEAGTVAFELAILHTKSRDFAGARAEYTRALELALTEEETITVHGNLAEVSMLDGELDASIHHFERCVSLARGAGSMGQQSLVLCLFGLAVALDRSGEPSAAVARARDAVGLTSSTAILRAEGVFFEPTYEIHHYEGLGQLALAELESDPVERRARLAGARVSFVRYLDEGGAHGPYPEAARRRVAELEAALAPPTTERRTRRPTR